MILIDSELKMISIKYLVYTNKTNLLYSQEIKKYGGDSLLCRDEEDIYPILSEITTFDIERFLPEDMDDLIHDLRKLKQNLNKKNDISYINDIIKLCEKCRDSNDGYIIFNPFVDRLELAKSNN